MQYQKRPANVEAIRLRYAMTIEGPNGTVTGKPGDWLVTEGERQYFMGSEDFNAAFAPKIDPPQVPPTYVPVPYPYPVYPQPSITQPSWQPRPWYLSTGGSVIGSTSGNINLAEIQGQSLTSGTATALNPGEYISDTCLSTALVNRYSTGD